LTKVQWSCLEKKWDSVRMIDLWKQRTLWWNSCKKYSWNLAFQNNLKVQLQQAELKPHMAMQWKISIKIKKIFYGNQRNVENPQDVLKSVAQCKTIMRS
jgi:hypothetical protein